MAWPLRKAHDWKNQVAPARPSFFEVKVFEDYVKAALKRHKRNLAILGATAEFRNLGHAYGLDVTLIESNKDHYDILSEQPRQHKGRERVRFEDWRKMKAGIKYDLVFGDGVANVIPKDQIPLVLKKFSAITAPDGKCILRAWLRENDNPPNLVKELELHRKNRDGMNLYTSCVNFFYLAAYDYENDKADFKKMRRLVKEMLLKKKITKEEFHQVADRVAIEKTEYCIPRRDEFEKMLKRHFKIETIRTTQEGFSKFGPIYVLRKK